MPDVLLKDKVYSFVKTRGLTIPLDVKRAFNLDLLISSAVLSELVSDGRLKTTWLKFGATPFYYPPDKVGLLKELRKYLNEKDKQVFDLLQHKKLLKDSELTPLQRIGLRNLKDFAIPLNIKNIDDPNKINLWWRWFLTSEQEALDMIKEISKNSKKQVLLQEEKKEKRLKPIENRILKSKKHKRVTKQELLTTANNYFKKKNIKIIDVLTTSNSQADFIIEVPSSIGRVKVYSRFKSKKVITDNDLASLFVVANSKNMPALLITNGLLTNKAKKMLNKEFQNLKVDKIDVNQ